MSKFKTLFEYLKTITLTILVTFVALIIFISITQHNVYEDTAKKEAQDETIEYYLIGVLIEKNKYLEVQQPDNYRINLKLGILYEIYKDYANAEAQYQLAIAKAPYHEYEPVNKLASFYISQNKLLLAQKLMDDIKEKPDKKLIKYKAEVYFKLGEKYYNMGNYLTSIEKYKKSLFYSELISSSKTGYIKECLASAYTYLAENQVDELKINDAINSLLTAQKYIEAPIIKYKLALLLMKDDPDIAYKYFEEVRKEEPSILNYDVYHSFLMDLSQAALSVGNTSESALYVYKAKKIKEYYESHMISVDDIKIEMVNGKMKTNFWTKKCAINLNFQLKNTSKASIKSLFVHIVFKDSNETIDKYSSQIIDAKTPLTSGSTSPIINIKTLNKKDKEGKLHQNIIAEIYVSKAEDSYKIHLTTIPIEEKKKKHKSESKWSLRFKQFLRKLYLRF